MPAGGEAWALGPALGHLTERRDETLLSWPKRQKEGKTVLGRGRTHPLGCSVCCQVAVTWWATLDWVCWHYVLCGDTVPQGKASTTKGPLPST